MHYSTKSGLSDNKITLQFRHTSLANDKNSCCRVSKIRHRMKRIDACSEENSSYTGVRRTVFGQKRKLEFKPSSYEPSASMFVSLLRIGLLVAPREQEEAIGRSMWFFGSLA